MNTSTDTPKASDPREDGRTIDVLGQWQRFVRGQPLSSPLRPLIYESWLRCRVAGIDPEPGPIRLRRVADADLQRNREGD